MTTPSSPTPAATLTYLRSLIPAGSLTLSNALDVAERQADYLSLRTSDGGPTRIPDVISELGHVTVIYEQTPVDAISNWNGTSWIIAIHARRPHNQRRVALARELGYVIWSQSRDTAEASDALYFSHIATYFAHCLLVPGVALIRLWENGIRDLDTMAHRFDVAEHTIITRLIQLRPWLNHARPNLTSWHTLVEYLPAPVETLTRWISGDHQSGVTP